MHKLKWLALAICVALLCAGGALAREEETQKPLLLYFFEIMTAFAGELLGINAFDQPGVEGGKQATYALLGKPGFDEKRAELKAAPAKNDKYII